MPTLAVPLTLSPGATADITGGTGIGLANQTGVTTIPSFTAITGTATLTITPKINGCAGTPQTVDITVNCCRPAVLASQSLRNSYVLTNGATPVIFSGSLAAAQAARIVIAGGVFSTSGLSLNYVAPVTIGMFLYGPAFTNCDSTYGGTRFSLAAGFPNLTTPIWETVDSVLVAIHP